MDPDATSLHPTVDAPADVPPAGTVCPNCQTANVPDALRLRLHDWFVAASGRAGVGSGAGGSP